MLFEKRLSQKFEAASFYSVGDEIIFQSPCPRRVRRIAVVAF
jgi:hypothetical protein